MRNLRKLLTIGVSVVVAVGTMSLSSANANQRFQRYQRFIDVGNLTAAAPSGKQKWEAQTGFTGGTVGTVANVRSSAGLNSGVAKTVLTGATAFVLTIPNGNYYITIWSLAPAQGSVTVTAETSVHRTIKARANDTRLRASVLKVSVKDGTLNLDFAPTANTLKIAALEINGGVWVSTTTTVGSTTTTTFSGDAPAGSTTTTSTTAATTTTTSKATTTTAMGSTTTAVKAAPIVPPVRDENSTDDNLGEWQMLCGLSHQAPNDPIVFPGIPGASHEHSFYGNTSTDAFSTPASLMASPSNCSRNMENSDHSGYWVPSLINKSTGQPEKGGDQELWVYYRRGGVPAGPPVQQPYPLGLRMLAGDPKATTPQAKSIVQWQCGFGGPTYNYIPNCSSDEIHATLEFPNCWNGKDLDSPDHRSHMAYAAYDGTCPADHPVVLPQMWFEVDYIGLTNGSQYTLASGGQDSMHGDFIAAWDPQVQRALVGGCLNPRKVCEGVTKNGNMLTAPGVSVDISKY